MVVILPVEAPEAEGLRRWAAAAAAAVVVVEGVANSSLIK